eukprot:5978988-Alexandrium_andersonii.AAC.1
MKPLRQGLPVRGGGDHGHGGWKGRAGSGSPPDASTGGAMCRGKNNWSVRMNKAQSQRYPLTGFNSGRCVPTAGPRAEAHQRAGGAT